MAAALMQTLDSTITNVALPTIQGNLGATPRRRHVGHHGLHDRRDRRHPAHAVAKQRFGRRSVLSSPRSSGSRSPRSCAATSESLAVLIAARAVQGAFGGGLLVMAQSIMRDTFPPSQLAASQGIFAIGAIMGPTLGPPLGGYLVDNFSWNWCFDINIVPGAFAAAILFLLLRDPTRPTAAGRIDAVGLVLLALGLGHAAIRAHRRRAELLVRRSAHRRGRARLRVCARAFVCWELARADEPVVDLRIVPQPHACGPDRCWPSSLGVAVFGSSYVCRSSRKVSLGFTPMLSGLLFLIARDSDRHLHADRGPLEREGSIRAICSGAGLVVRGRSGRVLQAGITTLTGRLLGLCVAARAHRGRRRR